jgi:hypothetical protein
LGTKVVHIVGQTLQINYVDQKAPISQQMAPNHLFDYRPAIPRLNRSIVVIFFFCAK